MAEVKPGYLGLSLLAPAEYARCNGHLYPHIPRIKKTLKARNLNILSARMRRKSQEYDGRSAAREP